jgi:ATP-binding cassette subfamily B protein
MEAEMKMKNEISNILRDAVRLLRMAWQEVPGLMTLTFVVVALSALMPFVQNFAIGELLNGLVESAGTGTIGSDARMFLVLMLVAGAAFGVFNTLQFFSKTVLYKVCFRSFAVKIHDRIASLGIASHEDPDRKDLITKVQENAMWRAPDFIQRMAYLCQNVLECAIATLVFLNADWRIGLFIFAASMPRLAIDILYNHRLWQAETTVSETRRKFWHTRYFLIDLRALTEVKLFQAVPFFVGLLEQHLRKIEGEEIKAERFNIKLQLIALLFSEGAAVAAIVMFVGQVLSGDIAVGTLAFYLTSLAAFRAALNMLSQNIGSQFRDGKFVRDMFELFEMPNEIENKADESPSFEEIQTLTFENVSFRYPGTEKWVIKNLNLALHSGQTLGIVAPNGSGKSTLAKLLCRIYEPTTGRILVNGVDYRDFDLDLWRSKLGVMLQEYSHYQHLDVGTAIRLGRITKNGHVGEQDLKRAALDSDAEQFIDELPWKFSTVLGRYFVNGIELSGGQYQKLAIARILYRNPAIAVFDEPTSAIDGESEARIFQSLLGALPGSIKILISHRFYTLKKADRICVLEAGSVREFGSHEELMELGGVYAERYNAQAQEYAVGS